MFAVVVVCLFVCFVLLFSDTVIINARMQVSLGTSKGHISMWIAVSMARFFLGLKCGGDRDKPG